jgi:HK97 family phage major capsid protein
VEQSLVNNDFAKAEAQNRLTDIGIQKTELWVKAEEENRELSASEARKLRKLEGEEADLQDRFGRAAAMEAELGRVPRNTDASYGTRARIGNQPSEVYRPDLPHSFFGDLVNRGQSAEAEVRMRRHIQEVGAEQRAMTTAGGSGIGIAPPQYLQDQIATFARAGRVLANLCQGLPLPDAGVTFNIPRVTTGTTTALQASEAAAVQDSSAVTDTIALTLNTVAGKVDVSRQLFDRSNPSADTILGQDLAADYAKQLDTQLISQATNGVLNLTGTNAITFTTGSPTVALLYPKLADAIQQVAVNRFAPATAIVMHPRRWAWVTAALDSQLRPLVVPEANGGVNAVAVFSTPTAEGAVGQMQGLPVYLDANIPTNLGAGTNQDPIVVSRFSDDLLFEDSAPTVAVYDGVLSANLQIRIMCFGYFAFTFARYPKSNSIINGTGLIPPTF